MADEHTIVVDFVLVEPTTCLILLQRRSSDRSVYPDRWELPGGHLEPGETIEQCIRRELAEECGMTLVQLLGKVYQFSWPDRPSVQNIVFAITARGVFRPEWNKISEFRWVDRAGAAALLQPDDTTRQPIRGGVCCVRSDRGRNSDT